jgi:D-xylose transport system ATP-binding protein
MNGLGFVNDPQMEAETRKIIAASTRTSGASIRRSPGCPGGQRQSVAIARAVYFNAKILIMDEPTAALGVQETQMVAELIGELKSAGHRHLPDRPRHPPGEDALRPRLSVMKNGQLVGTVKVDEVTEDDLLGMIIARQINATPSAGAA